MIAMQKKVVGVFAAILAVASAVSPGFQTALTEKAFGYSKLILFSIVC